MDHWHRVIPIVLIMVSSACICGLIISLFSVAFIPWSVQQSATNSCWLSYSGLILGFPNWFHQNGVHMSLLMTQAFSLYLYHFFLNGDIFSSFTNIYHTKLFLKVVRDVYGWPTYYQRIETLVLPFIQLQHQIMTTDIATGKSHVSNLKLILK